MNRDERIAYFKREAPEIVLSNQDFLNFLHDEGFFDAPASTKYHGVYDGGLFDHSGTVYVELKNLTEKLGLEWKRPESVFIVGMFHDLCKHDQYVKVPGTLVDLGDGAQITGPIGSHYEYNKKTLLKGHGSKSVIVLSRFLILTEEEQLCIRYHMGPYETEEWAEFDAAIRKYPNVFYTNAADMIASKVDDV